MLLPPMTNHAVQALRASTHAAGTHLAPARRRVDRYIDGVQPDEKQAQKKDGVGDCAWRQVRVIRVVSTQRRSAAAAL